jgi:hypothetical protein
MEMRDVCKANECCLQRAMTDNRGLGVYGMVRAHPAPQHIIIQPNSPTPPFNLNLLPLSRIITKLFRRSALNFEPQLLPTFPRYQTNAVEQVEVHRLSKMHPDVDEFGLDPISTIVVGGVMFILTAIALSLRVYVRGFLIKSFGWDDRLLCFAFFLYTGNCIILILMGATQAVNGIEDVSANRELGKVICSSKKF